MNEKLKVDAFQSCGVRIDAIPLSAAADLIVRGDAAGAVHLCNAYTLALAGHNDQLSMALRSSALNLPDGMPLIWIARRLGHRQMLGRVYGPDLMETCLDIGQGLGTKHYLYGSTAEVIEALQTNISVRWPRASIVGAESPPFSSDTAAFAESLDRMVESSADVVWVGLGTPKQDLVVDALARAHPGLTFVAVGAAFDFIAGTKKQAPDLVQRSGLEWLYRLITEPRRLWRRYLWGNSAFVYRNLRHRPVNL